MPSLSEHVPDDTDRCRADGLRWPDECERAQQELLASYRSEPTGLFLLMGLHIARAARRQPERSDVDLVRQYEGWIPGTELLIAAPRERHVPVTQFPQGVERTVFGANQRRRYR